MCVFIDFLGIRGGGGRWRIGGDIDGKEFLLVYFIGEDLGVVVGDLMGLEMVEFSEVGLGLVLFCN